MTTRPIANPSRASRTPSAPSDRLRRRGHPPHLPARHGAHTDPTDTTSISPPDLPRISAGADPDYPQLPTTNCRLRVVASFRFPPGRDSTEDRVASPATALSPRPCRHEQHHWARPHTSEPALIQATPTTESRSRVVAGPVAFPERDTAEPTSPPSVLYVKGNIPDCKTRRVGLAGTGPSSALPAESAVEFEDALHRRDRGPVVLAAERLQHAHEVARPRDGRA